MVLSQNTKRDSGSKVQRENINAGKTVGDVVRTCLGPKAMLKMLMDPMGGIVMTNDGNAILREITVQHPAAKSMIEIARTQDEEVKNFKHFFKYVYSRNYFFYKLKLCIGWRRYHIGHCFGC